MAVPERVSDGSVLGGGDGCAERVNVCPRHCGHQLPPPPSSLPPPPAGGRRVRVSRAGRA